MRNALALTVLPLFVFACERYPAAEKAEGNGRLSVSTSALDLAGVEDACYDLQVTNSAGEVLWKQPHVCSSSFGDGKGAIAYVGTCDAVNNPNEVSLVLTGLSDASGAPVRGFTNPCPEGAACKKTVACTENADTLVSFDLTLMRDAQQGFLDVSVSIEDVACSAKVDCVDELLANPATGARQPTAVVGFACSAGPSARAMYMTDITLDCDSPNGPISITVDPSKGPGNYSSSSVWGDPHEYLDEVASWRTTGSSSSSWTVGIAPDLAALSARGVTSCTLHAQATAMKDTSPDWKPGSGYPVVDYSVPLTSSKGTLALDCGSHALNQPSSGVAMKTIADGKHTKTGHVTLMK